MNVMRSLALAAGLVLVGPAGLFAEEAAEPVPENTAVEVKLDEKAVPLKFSLNGITGNAKKLFSRYLTVVSLQAPLTAIRADEKAKDFSWSVCRNAKGDTLVFVTQNKTDAPRILTFTLSGSQLPLTPTYRRVYSPDKGKTWKTIAFEPPHASISGCPQPMPSPYVIEIPPRSYQTATVRLK